MSNFVFLERFLNENSKSNKDISKTTYLKDIENVEINDRNVSKIKAIYGEIPSIVQKIISYSSSSVFLDNGCRQLSISEIIDADKDLEVDFGKLKMIPLFDCGENDFIVYNLKSNSWSKYNTNDNSVFKKSSSLKDLL